jgi:hypothetical protein
MLKINLEKCGSYPLPQVSTFQIRTNHCSPDYLGIVTPNIQVVILKISSMGQYQSSEPKINLGEQHSPGHSHNSKLDQ